MKNNDPFNCSHFRCAQLEFDLALGVIKNAHGETQRVSPINLKLLSYFLARQGDVISRTELFDAVWPNQIISDDVLTRAISDIRTQLTKLDASIRFIETLPKRGYRWVEIPLPLQTLNVSENGVDQINIISSHTTIRHAKSENRVIKNIVFYVILACLLAAAMTWSLAQSMATGTVSLAVLPVQADRLVSEPDASALDAALFNELRKNTGIKLLSQSAVSSRPANPFPYFFNEFGAKWVLESRISNLDGMEKIELSLVDARTGIEQRNVNFEVVNRADLLTKVAKKLEADLFAEQLAY